MPVPDQSRARCPRVLLLFSTSELGGAERSLVRMTCAGAGRVAYRIGTLDGPGPLTEWCQALGVDAVAFGARPRNGRHGRLSLLAWWRLLAAIRRERWDVIYVVGFRASVWVRLLRWLHGAKVVQGVRWNPSYATWLDRTFRLGERLLGALLDGYICNSRAAASTLRRLAGVSATRIRVVYNGLESLPVAIRSAVAPTPRVLTIANLSPRKGYLEYLEHVVAPLMSLDPAVRFAFVGRDEMAGAVERRAAALGVRGAVEIRGFLRDVGPELAAARVFVLPSQYSEGCPTSILEAMAYGLPVVAFSVDGIPELVEDGVTGHLIPPGNHAAMATAIAGLLSDPQRSLRFGAAGRRRVEREFLASVCYERHADAFTDIIAGRSAQEKSE